MRNRNSLFNILAPLVLLTLITARPVLAGHWQTTYTKDGISLFTTSDGEYFCSDWEQDNPGENFPLYEDMFGPMTPGGSADFTQTGSITATLTWIHDDPTNPQYDPPPATVWLKEGSYATWQGVNWTDVAGTTYGYASNGDNDQESDYSVMFGSHHMYGGDTGGVHFRKVDSSSGTITRTHSFDAMCHVDAGPYYFSALDSWEEWVGCSYEIQVAAPFMVTSDTIENSSHKEFESDLYGAPVPKPDRRNSDYTIQTNSAVYWNYPHGRWEGMADFRATDLGFNNPVWNWTPGGSTVPYSWELMNAATFTFDLGSAQGLQSLGQSTTTKAEVKDGSDDPLSNTFTVQWHLPLENWSEWQAALISQEPTAISIDAPGYMTTTFGVLVHWNEEPLWGEVGGALEAVSSFIGNPIYSGLFNVAGIAVSDAVPTPYNVTPNFDAAWDNVGSTFTPNKDESKKDHYRMVPRLTTQYTTRYWQGDGYSPHGYEGPARKRTKRQSGLPTFVGDFTLFDGTNGRGPDDH